MRPIEVCDGLIYMIDHWDERDEISIETLMGLIPGPDFPTGGIILGNEGITHAYATGKGRVCVRAVTHVEEMSRGRHRIVVTELPYQTNKSSLLERIATLVREGRLTQISDLRDESDRRGMSIVIELKNSAQPLKVLNRLYKYTLLQSTFGVQILALVNGEPRLLTLKRALEIHVEHRREIIIRRSKYELAKAEARAHILEGLKIALDHLDAVITTIRESPDVDTARTLLIERFNLTQEQAQAILDMRLRRLAGLERLKIDEEYEELIRQIAYLEDLLASPRKILALIRNDLEELKETYGDPRRTRIVEGVDGSLDETDLVAEEEVIVSITQKGYIKRVPTRVYRTQGRGGRGVIGMSTKEEDNVLYAFSASTLDSILFFTNQGKVYQERAYQIPDAGRTSQGVLIVSILPLEVDERVTAAVPVSDFEEDQFLTMITVQGRAKRTPLSEFASVRPSGLIAISLDGGDELGWVRVTPGDAELILVTKQGQALRFPEEEIRPMGRSAMGVYGIRLREEDELTSAEVVIPGADLLVATTRGYGKRTSLEEFRTQGRYTMGVICVGGKPHIRGPVAAARVVKPGDEVTFLSKDGMALRGRVDDIPQMGRSARGANLMDLKKGDRLASMAVLDDETEEQDAE
jgi:DNA gyrase subunit A